MQRIFPSASLNCPHLCDGVQSSLFSFKSGFSPCFEAKWTAVRVKGDWLRDLSHLSDYSLRNSLLW